MPISTISRNNLQIPASNFVQSCKFASVTEIAKRLGRHRRTIEREITRGTIYLQNSDLTYRKEYCADVAQRRYVENGRIKVHG